MASQINFISFNQDNSLLGVGTTQGFRLFTTEPFSRMLETQSHNVALVEMLFSTSLIAIVLSPRQLRIHNTKRQSTICELTFPGRIVAVRMNRKRLAVVLEDAVYVYDISNMKLLITLETSPNPYAICALSPSSDNNYLVYPRPQKPTTPSFAPPSHLPPSSHASATASGEVMIYDASKLEQVSVIEAHQAPLSHVTLNAEGTLLATASEKGTIIRVFSVPDGKKLLQLRRGSIPARIFCMSFNTASTLLCVSSATETVHIFRLSTSGPAPAPTSPTSLRRASLGPRERSPSPNSDEVGTGTGTNAEEGGEPTSGQGSPTSRAANPSLAGMLRRTSKNMSRSLAATVGGYLPSAVSEIWEPQRDFAWVKLPKPPGSNEQRAVVALSNNHPQLMVGTAEGAFYAFNLDLEHGGEGVLQHNYSWV